MNFDAADIQPLLDFASSDERAGFRLHRLEVLNWGTFDRHIWRFDLHGDNTLLTGDIGSGKSTLVDAVITLLVPPQRIAYNKAAGAESRERTLKSYVLGYYKAERSEAGSSARPVGLRDHNSYSVILGHFFNEGYGQHVTLAQVFWVKDTEGQPARLFVLADEELSIQEHFAGFGPEIGDLRKRLRRRPRAELFDTFPPYGAAFRRRFGIENEQALELFHQTVSMKSIGNLTDFVRQHMLEEFPVEPRIQALITHFENLNRAHEAVLRAKAQVERLAPLVTDYHHHAELDREIEELRSCRDALRPWFATRKLDLLQGRIATLERDVARLGATIDMLESGQREQRGTRDELKEAISNNGGDRLERIRAEIARKEIEKEERRGRSARYGLVAASLGLAAAVDEATFYANQIAVASERSEALSAQASAQNARTDAEVDFRRLRAEHEEILAELISLRERRSNLPSRMLELRASLCAWLGDVRAEDLPFAGELIQVRDDASDWEGAIERLLHNFGLSLLVEDAHYPRVVEWVERTQLGARLVYYRVRGTRETRPGDRRIDAVEPHSLVRKLAIKPDSSMFEWIETELANRFDYVCCNTLDQFRREQRAITRAGQTKGRGERHEKDDRNRLDDRSRYILGWSNDAKIDTLEGSARRLEVLIQDGARVLEEFNSRLEALSRRIADTQRLEGWASFREMDWQPLVLEIHALDQERLQLESGSDVLRTLVERLGALEREIAGTEGEIRTRTDQRAETKLRQHQARELANECTALLSSTPDEIRDQFARLLALRDDALGTHTLTVESCDNRERDMRQWLQERIDSATHRLSRLAERIVATMTAYRKDYPLETQDMDASVAAAPEYEAVLERLRSDDLPRFEARFKTLLNENTIREVANFQSQLARERQSIRERIGRINQSLREIDYNPGRYIVLEDEPTTDVEVRDFQSDLRACTEGTLTSSEEEAYSERKFDQVQRIIARFQGRPGFAELDRRWTRKVTDVRGWFVFAASERWREDDRDHEHYTDSGGKSGGQKEKLAYTILAASLAYQFGLDWVAKRSRSFRFVAIDEAFGRGSDESARYALALFAKLRLQLLIVTPLQKIHVIEPHVAAVGFVNNEDGNRSMLRNLTIEEYKAERTARAAAPAP